MAGAGRRALLHRPQPQTTIEETRPHLRGTPAHEAEIQAAERAVLTEALSQDEFNKLVTNIATKPLTMVIISMLTIGATTGTPPPPPP